MLNAEAALDLGLDAGSHEPPLRGSVTVPLTHDGRVVGVLSCYSAAMPGFTEDHLRLLELAAASLGSALAAVGTFRDRRAAGGRDSGGRRGASVLSLVRG